MTVIEQDDILDEEPDTPTGRHVAREPGTAMLPAAAQLSPELSVDEVVARVEKVREVAQRVMKQDVHFGTIPGTPKPTLYKAGAEILCLTFRLDPQVADVRERWYDDGHYSVTVTTRLIHVATGLEVASGIGSCTTQETRYAYRNAGRACPVCGVEAIIKGKAEYGGGWLCFARKGGCGAKWPDDSDQAREFETAEVGKVARPREELADAYNTVLKMASKRSLIDAVLRGTAASEIYTQDLEDFQASKPDEEKRQGSAAVRAPKSWPDLQRFIEGFYGPDAWEEFSVFTLDAAVELFGERDTKKLTPDQRKALRVHAADAAVRLREALPVDFPPPTRGDMARAWASEVGGVVLEGPAWRMSADEQDRPPKGGVEPPAEPPAAAAASPFDADASDIPFD